MNTKKVLTRVFFGAVINLFAIQLYAFPDCPKGHCANVDPEINEDCMKRNQNGKPYLVGMADGSFCFCPCSCVAIDTKIGTFDDYTQALKIDELVLGQKLQAPLSKNAPNKVGKLLSSDFSEITGKVHRMKFSNGEDLVVSPEHSFVVPTMKVRAAEELAVGSLTLDGNMKEVTVLENTVDENFNGMLMNLIINEKSTKARNHFIVTNSILSGDWLIQSNYSSFKLDIDARMGRIDTFQTK